MAYTLRTDKDDEEAIKKLKEHLGVGHATRALLMAARNYPGLVEELRSCQQELADTTRKLNSINYLLQERASIEARIEGFFDGEH